MSTRACANCGNLNSATARFCTNCGAPQPDPEPYVDPVATRLVPWRALEGLGIWIIATMATFAIALPLAALVAEDTAEVLLILFNEVLLAIIVVVWVKRRHRVGLEGLGLKGRGSDVGIGVALGFFGYLIAGLVGYLISEAIRAVTNRPVEPPEQISVDDPNTMLLVLIGIGVVVLAPLAEEMLFRGVIYRGLRNWARPGAAIVMSAIFFAVAHVIPLVIAPIFVLGLLLAWIVEVRGSIVPSVAAHVTFNAIGFTFLILEKG